MHKIIEFVCDELKDLEHKVEKEGSLSQKDFDYLKDLTEVKKDLLKTQMLEEESEYSNAMGGGSYRGYSRGYDMMGGGSYADDMGYSRAEAFVRPDGSYRGEDMSYARGRGRGARRDSMGRYSSAGSEAEELRRMLGRIPDENTRREMEKIIDRM